MVWIKVKKKIFGIFDTRSLIWFHYMLLVGALFLFHEIGVKLFDLDNNGYFYMFIYYFLVISISDQLIHYILGVD